MAAKNKDALKLEAMKALRAAIEADDYEALKKAVEEGKKKMRHLHLLSLRQNKG